MDEINCDNLNSQILDSISSGYMLLLKIFLPSFCQEWIYIVTYYFQENGSPYQIWKFIRVK